MDLKKATQKVREYMKDDAVLFRFGRDYHGLYLFYISPTDSGKSERNFDVAKIVVMKNSGKVIPEVDLDQKDMANLRGPWEPITFSQ